MTTAARPPFGRIAFAVVMLALTALFVVLGLWQMQRLGEKQALLAMIEERLNAQPQPLPPVAEWAALDGEGYDYRPVSIEGRFVTGATVLVFTSLADPRGEQGGPGYWVMTPFVLDGGGTVFVNRGFVPQQTAADRAALEPINPASGTTRLTGIARRPEQASVFTPAPDTEKGIDWIRNPERLATLGAADLPVAPIYLDLPAGSPGELPQGGETVLEFSDNHLGYALTWFGFALLTPILLGFWLRRQKSPEKP